MSTSELPDISVSLTMSLNFVRRKSDVDSRLRNHRFERESRELTNYILFSPPDIIKGPIDCGPWKGPTRTAFVKSVSEGAENLLLRWARVASSRFRSRGRASMKK